MGLIVKKQNNERALRTNKNKRNSPAYPSLQGICEIRIFQLRDVTRVGDGLLVIMVSMTGWLLLYPMFRYTASEKKARKHQPPVVSITKVSKRYCAVRHYRRKWSARATCCPTPRSCPSRTGGLPLLAGQRRKSQSPN